MASNLCPAGNPGRAGWADIAGQIGLADLAANLDPGRDGWAKIASQNGLADLATNLDFHSAGYRDHIFCDIEILEVV